MSTVDQRLTAAPRSAASVILLRERPETGATEIFLVCRHRKASFMSSSYVFPGGTQDPGDGDLRITAARELFEEAGVLLATNPGTDADRARWRKELADGATPEQLAIQFEVDILQYFAHWITPEMEGKRFSARFYVAKIPSDQTPSFDNVETVDEVWVTPDEALTRAGELRLPPPQVRTMVDLQAAARAGLASVFALAEVRARHPYPLLPRVAPMPGTPKGFALLLPWDPDYTSKGTGEAIELPSGHPLATGPSRFVLDGKTWNHIDAQNSPPAG